MRGCEAANDMPRLPLSRSAIRQRQNGQFDPPPRKHRKASANTARPTANPGTKVTTRFPSGVSQDTAPDVTKAAKRPMAIGTRDRLGCERSPGLALVMASLLTLAQPKAI